MTIKVERYSGHVFEYSIDGERYGITIPATNEADARRRLALASIGAYLGNEAEVIRVTRSAEVTGLWVRFLTFWRNLTRS